VIEGAAQQDFSEPVLRLIGLPSSSIETILLQRGLNPDALEEVREAIASVGLPFTLEEALVYPFRSLDGEPPYRVGRFGNGQIGVFYSALEEDTCIAEILYYNRVAFEQQRLGNVPFARYYQLMACEFTGSAMMLVGREQQYPDLVSATDAGYPFCQGVALWAINEGADALHTTSARRAGGTCVPVFTKDALSAPRSLDRFRFSIGLGQQDVTSERVVSAE
jgi:hypothetical protein